jgi:hypothetical protein
LGIVYKREGALPLLAYTAKKDYNRELLIYNNKLFISISKDYND